MLQHPSLPSDKDRQKAIEKWTPPSVRGIFKVIVPELRTPEWMRKKWKKYNEERMLEAWKAFGGLQLRVKFELLEQPDLGRKRYKTITGSTLVFKKIPTPGKLLGIIRRLTDSAMEEVRKTRDVNTKEVSEQ